MGEALQYPLTREQATKKAKFQNRVATQMQKVDMPTRMSRGNKLRKSRSPELRSGHKRVKFNSTAVEKAVAGSIRRNEVKKSQARSTTQKAITKSADAAADVAKTVDLKKANLKKAALGAGATLAAYGAYRMYKRRKANKEAAKTESVEGALEEMMDLAEEHFDYAYSDTNEFIECLIEATYDYDDDALLEDIEGYISDLTEKEDDSPRGLKSSRKVAHAATVGELRAQDSYKGLKSGAKIAAAATVGELASTAIWNKLASKKKRGRLLKSVGLGKRGPIRKGLSAAAKSPYAKGAAVTALGLGAAELARRTLARRKEAKRNKGS